MYYRKLLVPAFAAVIGMATAVGTLALANESKEAQPAADKKPADKAAAAPQGQPQLPPGWTEADMQACIAAGTPGEMHKKLQEQVGTWVGKNQMWMMPDSEPVTSEVKSVVKPLMDGRFVQIEMQGEMPGMGPYHGLGQVGYDNVKKKLVATWLDNHSTAILFGTGEVSKDGKSHTIEYSYTCPINNKPAVMREVETITGPNTKVFEMFGAEPKSGKEYKIMRIEWTKQS